MKHKSQDISPKCEYCLHARPAPGGDTMLCPKKGIVAPDFHCRRYQYDILKRQPRKAPNLPQFSAEDFSL